ncbi:MAG: hypothetical protein AB8U25_00445 [Rickettsiales endosymbiont of Dermacentor nuttalli]
MVTEPILSMETCQKLIEGINEIVVEKGQRLSNKIFDVLSICTNIVMNYFDETCKFNIVGPDNYLQIKIICFTLY